MKIIDQSFYFPQISIDLVRRYKDKVLLLIILYKLMFFLQYFFHIFKAYVPVLGIKISIKACLNGFFTYFIQKGLVFCYLFIEFRSHKIIKILYWLPQRQSNYIR